MKRVLAVLAVLSLFGVLFLVSCGKSKAPEQAQQSGGAAPGAEERVEKNPSGSVVRVEHGHHLFGPRHFMLLPCQIPDLRLRVQTCVSLIEPRCARICRPR